jgi:N-acetylglucosaminyldiphosphoundecaprenol N-acetyl-beta-D-mannosaminyltransferase
MSEPGTTEQSQVQQHPPTGPRRGVVMPTVTGRQFLLGVWIDPLTLDETVDCCIAAVEANERLEVGVVNAAKIVNMRRDSELRNAVLGCDLIVADGQSVVWASRIFGTPLPGRVAGIDLFQRLLVAAEQRGLSVYFLGAREDVLARMIARLRRDLPELRIAGCHHGYFAEDDAPERADEIKGSGADLLFLGMTSPRKERFVAMHGERTGAKVVHGVGGSFDVLAGEVRRAPQSWQRIGMEWLYRALQEPRRLGKRYLTTNAAFVTMVARERFSSRKAPARTDSA